MKFSSSLALAALASKQHLLRGVRVLDRRPVLRLGYRRLAWLSPGWPTFHAVHALPWSAGWEPAHHSGLCLDIFSLRLLRLASPGGCIQDALLVSIIALSLAASFVLPALAAQTPTKAIDKFLASFCLSLDGEGRLSWASQIEAEDYGGGGGSNGG